MTAVRRICVRSEDGGLALGAGGDDDLTVRRFRGPQGAFKPTVGGRIRVFASLSLARECRRAKPANRRR